MAVNQRTFASINDEEWGGGVLRLPENKSYDIFNIKQAKQHQQNNVQISVFDLG